MNLMNIYQTKRVVQSRKQKKRAAAADLVQQNIEPTSTRNGKVRIQLNVFKAIHIHFGVFPVMNEFGVITRD